MLFAINSRVNRTYNGSQSKVFVWFSLQKYTKSSSRVIRIHTDDWVYTKSIGYPHKVVLLILSRHLLSQSQQ